MRLTFREPGRKLVCKNYGCKCHQQHEAIQPHWAWCLRRPLCETELGLPPPCQRSLPRSWPVFIHCCLHTAPPGAEREEQCLAQCVCSAALGTWNMDEWGFSTRRLGRQASAWERCPGTVPTSLAAGIWGGLGTARGGSGRFRVCLLCSLMV